MTRGYFSVEKYVADCVKDEGYFNEFEPRNQWAAYCDGLPVNQDGKMFTAEGFTFDSKPDWEVPLSTVA